MLEIIVLDGASWSGGPVEIDSHQIVTLIENNLHYTIWETANTLKISKSIKLLVKMQNVSFILWKKTYKFFANLMKDSKKAKQKAQS